MSSVEFKFENGIEVLDTVTNVKGIINGRMECLNGCIRYSVQPKAKGKDATTVPDSWWLDEAQLKKVGNGVRGKVEVKRTGGMPTKSKF